jgi:hypothetical protein
VSDEPAKQNLSVQSGSNNTRSKSNLSKELCEKERIKVKILDSMKRKNTTDSAENKSLQRKLIFNNYPEFKINNFISNVAQKDKSRPQRELNYINITNSEAVYIINLITFRKCRQINQMNI